MTRQRDIAVRQIQGEDYESLARLLEENNKPEITRYFHPFPMNSKTACQIAFTEHLDRYYIAVKEEQVLGLCMLRGWDEGFQTPSLGVLVDQRYRGLGAARKMTRFAIAEARKMGCLKIRLTVYFSNTPALNLYSLLGFREISRESVIIAGEPDIKIVMTKDLEHGGNRKRCIK